MAKWNNIKSATGGTVTGSFHYDNDKESTWQIYQDEKPFLEEAKRERESTLKKNSAGHKKFATIPDIVAIEVWEKHGINIHDLNFMHDRDKMRRFKQIIMTEYPHLVINKA